MTNIYTKQTDKLSTENLYISSISLQNMASKLKELHIELNENSKSIQGIEKVQTKLMDDLMSIQFALVNIEQTLEKYENININIEEIAKNIKHIDILSNSRLRNILKHAEKLDILVSDISTLQTDLQNFNKHILALHELNKNIQEDIIKSKNTSSQIDDIKNTIQEHNFLFKYSRTIIAALAVIVSLVLAAIQTFK